MPEMPCRQAGQGRSIAGMPRLSIVTESTLHSALRCAMLTPPSIHITIKEQLSLTLQRDGGLDAFELKGDLDLRVSDADKAKLRVTLASEDYSNLQFKQHPNVAKFAASGDKVIQLKDASRSFPVGQGLGVLRWRVTGKDESWVPLTGMCSAFRLCRMSPGRGEGGGQGAGARGEKRLGRRSGLKARQAARESNVSGKRALICSHGLASTSRRRLFGRCGRIRARGFTPRAAKRGDLNPYSVSNLSILWDCAFSSWPNVRPVPCVHSTQPTALI